MAYIDLPIDELKSYLPERREPDDFDSFWKGTIDESGKYPLDPIFEPVDYFIKTFTIFDVTFNGYMGEKIKGWLIFPKEYNEKKKLPCVVKYIGYTGGRGFPFDHLVYPSAGYALFVMDTRGQGSAYSFHGETPDPHGSEPMIGGFMTKGITSPYTYYYRRVFTDAIRAVEVVKNHPFIDPEKIAVTGGSQGGGITLAVAGLSDIPRVAMPDVPFLCHFKRAVTLVDSFPYQEIVLYLKSHRDMVNTVFKTLSYFDGMNFAVRAKAKALFSVGLMDTTCPPSTVFAAYNYYRGPKEIKIYEFNQHEGGGSFHTLEKLEFLEKHIIQSV